MEKSNQLNQEGVDIFKLASNRMLSAWVSFHMWKWLEQARNTNNPKGEKFVNENIKVINDYGWLLPQIMSSLYKSFVIDLWIFFDKNYTDTLSIRRLVDSITNKISSSKLTQLLSDIDRIKKAHKVTIDLASELRTMIAHQIINEKKISLIYTEFENLFSGVQEILNLISKYYDGSFTVWDHIPADIENELEVLFENLKRGEKVRIDEINEKYS